MASLFDQTAINGMTIRNRLVRSATWEGMCEADGRPTRRLADYYRELARGGVGLIISGYTFVRPDGKQLPGKMGIHTDDFADEMRVITGAVHEEGGKICIQLVHVGGQTDSATAGRRPLAPSAVEVEQFPEVPQEMSVNDITEIVAASPNSTDERVAAVQVVDFTEKSMVLRILGKGPDAPTTWALRCEIRERLIVKFRDAGLPLPRIRVSHEGQDSSGGLKQEQVS